MGEIENIKERYKRREDKEITNRYNILNPEVYLSFFEKEQAILEFIRKNIEIDLQEVKLLEVGCGSGANILSFIRYGMNPTNLVGNELLSERLKIARNILPSDVKLLGGDARQLELKPEFFDIVFQSTVFTSILDDKVQNELAQKMWSLLKPGSFILWYDFVYDNPNNKDVRGVKLVKIKELFPKGRIKFRKITLAPPLARKLVKIHPVMCTLFNMLPFLRTHVLVWIQKPK